MLTGLLSLEGAGVAVLSFVAGESIAGPVAAGLALASVGGVLLVAARTDDAPVRSVVLTMCAVACNGAGLFSVGYADVDVASTMVLFNGASAVVIAGVLKAQGIGLTKDRFESLASESWMILASALGLIGLFAFAIGSREGSAAVTAVFAAQFAGVAAIVAYFHFKERMGRSQLLGFGILVLGVSLVAAFA
jgi:drug/metabolite transporter (DMT)-like permease